MGLPSLCSAVGSSIHAIFPVYENTAAMNLSVLLVPYPGSHRRAPHLATLVPCPINTLLPITCHRLCLWNECSWPVCNYITLVVLKHPLAFGFDECTPVTMQLTPKVPAPSCISGEHR